MMAAHRRVHRHQRRGRIYPTRLDGDRIRLELMKSGTDPSSPPLETGFFGPPEDGGSSMAQSPTAAADGAFGMGPYFTSDDGGVVDENLVVLPLSDYYSSHAGVSFSDGFGWQPQEPLDEPSASVSAWASNLGQGQSSDLAYYDHHQASLDEVYSEYVDLSVNASGSYGVSTDDNMIAQDGSYQEPAPY